MRKKIFLICTEKSGDVISSEIIEDISKLIGDIEIIGIFGLESEGVCKRNNIKYNKLVDIGELSVMGFVEILPKLLSIIKIINKVTREVLCTNPALVITIDGYDLCSRIVKKVHQCNHNIPFFHVVAPTVWAYKSNRIAVIQKHYKALFCLLPFEPTMFDNQSLKTYFVGYPAIHKYLPHKIDIDKYLSNNFSQSNGQKRVVSITLGSRTQEVNKHFPIIEKVINKISNYDRNIEFYILSTLELESKIRALLIKQQLQSNVSIVTDKDSKIDIARRSALIIAKSGTNTMEFIALGIPLIVYYKVNSLTMFIIVHIKKLRIRLVNLFNIYKNREVIPEFVFNNKCNYNAISDQVIQYLSNKDVAIKQLESTKEVKNMIKERQPSSYIAEIVVDFLK